MKTIIIDGIEYNLTPKVLFKKGDFVVIQETTYLISKIEGLNVTLSCNGRDCLFDIDVLKSARLWDIPKDAKDGDVLASELCDSIILFKGINDDNNIDFYCDYDFSEIDVPGDRFTFNNGQNYGNVEDSKDFHPATKEQRDTLMKAMADAGYTFDFDKKELKKIEQKPAWSERDERAIHCLEYTVKHFYEGEDTIKWWCDWFKSLKDRVQLQPVQEWNGGDDAHIHSIITHLQDFIESHPNTTGADIQGENVAWLKSLKDRYTWKPSERQIQSIKDCALNKNIDAGTRLVLDALYQDLKKLKR